MFRSRYWPTALAILTLIVLGWYLVYTELLAREMRRDAELHSQLYSLIYQGLSSPDPTAATSTLLALGEAIGRLGIPIVVADVDGFPVDWRNLPFPADVDDPADQIRVLEYMAQLSSVPQPDIGIVYIGEPPVVERLRWIPWLQVGFLVCLIAAAIFVIRHNQRVERDRIWATMARESAHQMATPLSSLTGWVEILRLPTEEREEMSTLPSLTSEMEADLERLEKVSHRFEWIGRPIRWEAVDARGILKTLERYVRVRMPQLSQNVELTVEIEDGLPPIRGNAVLLEWAVENLVKNALDAVAGAGGAIQVTAGRDSEKGIAIRISDDGPGVAQHVRSTLFDAGVTTKKGGWGVGLSLSRRIIQDVHGGRLTLDTSTPGATFIVELPIAETA